MASVSGTAMPCEACTAPTENRDYDCVSPNLIESIAQHALAAPVPGVRIIGIDGPSGSGKSPLAGPLAARLGAPVIEADDFVSWVDFSGWWPRFEEQVLEPLFAREDAVYQRRDWAGDEFGAGLGEWRTVPWAPVVVIEGVTCTRAAAADRLACRVWVEAPADERLRRGQMGALPQARLGPCSVGGRCLSAARAGGP